MTILNNKNQRERTTTISNGSGQTRYWTHKQTNTTGINNNNEKENKSRVKKENRLKPLFLLSLVPFDGWNLSDDSVSSAFCCTRAQSSDGPDKLSRYYIYMIYSCIKTKARTGRIYICYATRGRGSWSIFFYRLRDQNANRIRTPAQFSNPIRSPFIQ